MKSLLLFLLGNTAFVSTENLRGNTAASIIKEPSTFDFANKDDLESAIVNSKLNWIQSMQEQLKADDIVILNLRKSNQEKVEKIELLERVVESKLGINWKI